MTLSSRTITQRECILLSLVVTPTQNSITIMTTHFCAGLRVIMVTQSSFKYPETAIS